MSMIVESAAQGIVFGGAAFLYGKFALGSSRSLELAALVTGAVALSEFARRLSQKEISNLRLRQVVYHLLPIGATFLTLRIGKYFQLRNPDLHSFFGIVCILDALAGAFVASSGDRPRRVF